MRLTTTAFEPGGQIPTIHTCDGSNTSPALAWEGAPPATKSFALIVDDPDAPGGDWVHWVVFDLPAGARRLSGGIQPGANFVIAAVLAIAANALVFTAAGSALPNRCEVGASRSTAAGAGVSILVYHRFGIEVRDSMTVRPSTFEWQLRYLNEHQYRVVSLRAVVAHLRSEGPPLPPGSVVITADDGHESVFTDMLPMIRKYHVPVTLFIYPSAISNASYAMTWRQLQTLRDSGLVDVQSHTYWHPNFATEQRRLTPNGYREFVTMQLCKSRTVLRDRLGVEARFLSWPFGIHDEQLEDVARACGYDAAVTLAGRRLEASDHLMALPRFLVTDTAMGSRFAAMLPSDTSR